MTISEYKQKLISVIEQMEKEYGADLKDCAIWTDIDEFGFKSYKVNIRF